jgi:hypothetical protein
MPVWPCVSNVPSGDRAQPMSPTAAEPHAEGSLPRSTRSLPEVEVLLPRDLNRLTSGVSRELLFSKPLFCVQSKCWNREDAQESERSLTRKTQWILPGAARVMVNERQSTLKIWLKLIIT